MSQDTSESVYGLGITPGLGYITGPEGQRAEQEALRKDRSQARRVVVSLVGRERQGKTSLRRLLSGEPFNSDEPSTVGLERQLVDTQALDPTSGVRGDWKSLKLDAANVSEYHEVLGRKIHHRLENQRHKIPASRRALNAFLTMAKIGSIGYVSLAIFFLVSSSAWLSSLPALGLSVVVMFILCGATFGKRDGFGIAVGIYHLIILTESLVRWRIGSRFEELVPSYGVVGGYVLGAVCYGMMEAFVATCFGMSLGLGMACVFCMSRPDSTDYFQHGNPLLQMDMYVLIVSCLFGLGFMLFKYTRFAIPVVLALICLLLPLSQSFVFLCGTTIGVVHGIFLSIGRSLFLALNYVIKSVTNEPLGRHILRHLVGLIPGLFVSQYLFAWRLVTSPVQAVVAHVLSALLLIAVNEIDSVSVRIVPCLSVSFSLVSSSSSSMSSSSSSSSSSVSSPSSSSSSSVSSPTSASSPSLSSASSTTRSPACESSEQSASSSGSSLPSARSASFSTAPHSASSPSDHHLHQKYMDQLLSRPRSDSLAKDQPTSVLAKFASAASDPVPRLVVRDFAGHPLYYSAHHVYMAAQCIYVLVFSLVEARRDFDFVLRNLIDWLQSIYLHTGFPDTRVFIVGSHRDDSGLKVDANSDGDGVDGEDFVTAVGQRLRKELPTHFHKLLVWTESDTPLFPVENSLRDHKDKDHRYLRQQLLKTAEELNTDKFPVRYFYFFVVLDELRATGKILADTDSLLDHCTQNHCAVKDRDDLDAMLGLFRQLGEVLYFPEDNLLQSVVVLSPHAVLEILSRLLDVPRMVDRHRNFVDQWGSLASTGICSRALFEHVLSLHSKYLRAQSDTVLYLLQTLNLICPLKVRTRGGGDFGSSAGVVNWSDGVDGGSGSGLRHRRLGGRRRSGGGGGGGGDGGGGGNGNGDGDGDGSDSDSDNNNNDDDNDSNEDNTDLPREPTEHDEQGDSQLFLVPAALPFDLPQEHCTWDTRPGDWTLLIDGLPVLPHPAFLRLLSLCASQDACDTLDHLGRPVLTAAQSRAAFTLGRGRCYKLEWMTSAEVTHIYHGRLLKVVVAGERENSTLGGVQSLGAFGETTRSNRVSSGSLENSNSETVPPKVAVEFVWKSLSEIIRRDFPRCHVRLGVACPCSAPHQVPSEEAGFHFLLLSDTRDGMMSQQIPDEEGFWCRGRHVRYKNGKVFESSPRSDSHVPGLTQLMLTTPLRAIPQSLHAGICDLLDVPHPLGNDWTALAGALGKTAKDVELIRFRAPLDPCAAILKDWASRDPDVTLRDLADVMRSMQRLDVLRTIEDFCV